MKIPVYTFNIGTLSLKVTLTVIIQMRLCIRTEKCSKGVLAKPFYIPFVLKACSKVTQIMKKLYIIALSTFWF